MSVPHTHYRMVIPPKNTHGIMNSFEFAVYFLTWCNGTVPTARRIMDYFGVSRATASRYRSAYQIWLEKQQVASSPKHACILALLGVDSSITCG